MLFVYFTKAIIQISFISKVWKPFWNLQTDNTMEIQLLLVVVMFKKIDTPVLYLKNKALICKENNNFITFWLGLY